jgi:hypothetical protein
MSKTDRAKRPIGGTHKYLTDEQSVELKRRACELSGQWMTPRLRNGRRIGIVLDVAAFRQVRGRGLGYRGVVTDLNTGNLYGIVGANCDFTGCECDAIAIRIELPEQPRMMCRRVRRARTTRLAKRCRF